MGAADPAADQIVRAGDRLPEARLARFGQDGPEAVSLAEYLAGRDVVIFAVPGAFTPTCDSAHMPSFVRTRDSFTEHGIDEVICVAVNDIHVMRRWGETTGAQEAGITLLSDGDGAFTRALGLAYDNPGAAMFGRSKRYAMVVRDGVVGAFFLDPPGTCTATRGEALIDSLKAAASG